MLVIKYDHSHSWLIHYNANMKTLSQISRTFKRSFIGQVTLMVLIVLAFPNLSATILSFFFLFPLPLLLYFSLSLCLVTESCAELTAWPSAALQECAPVPAFFLSLRSMCGHCGWSERLLGYWLRKWSINSAKQKAFHFLFLKTTLNSNLSFPMGIWLSKASGWGRPTCLSTDDSEQSGGGVDTGSGLGWSDFSSWYCICQPCDLERFMC